jgi:hypothetical protein
MLAHLHHEVVTEEAQVAAGVTTKIVALPLFLVAQEAAAVVYFLGLVALPNVILGRMATVVAQGGQQVMQVLQVVTMASAEAEAGVPEVVTMAA